MIRTFIQTTEFMKALERLGLNDDDLRRLETGILLNPQAGKVIQGTGGLRKLRFAFENRGKRGSVRVCYVDFVVKEVIYLITAYSKNEKDNLTISERQSIRKMIEALEQES